MNSPDDEFYACLLDTFREDAKELLTSISDGLIRLERGGSESEQVLIEEIFRKTHSLKGAARAVNLRDIELICLNLENIFSLIKRGDVAPTADDFDLFHDALKSIKNYLSGGDDTSVSPVMVVQRLRALLAERKPGELVTGNNISRNDLYRESGYYQRSTDNQKQKTSVSRTPDPAAFAVPSTFLEVKPASSSPGPGKQGSDQYYPSVKGDDGTVRIASKKLDRLIIGSDDLLSTRLFLTHRMQELEEMMSRFSLWRWNHSLVFNDMHLIREIFFSTNRASIPPELVLFLERVVDFLKYDREFVTNLQHDIAAQIRAIDLDRSALETSTTEIADLIHDAILVPVSSILTMVAGLIREDSRNLGKRVDLITEGGEIEMDRRLLDMLKVPLMHLIHNCVDHGIEYPDERESAGKNPEGIVRIKITPHSGSKVEITVSDDGKGIDRDLIRRTAREKGLLTEEEEGISDNEAIWLIFRSGLTTSPKITELSGRGLGLAIVEDTITRMGGEVGVSSERGIGTTFSLILPIRLATLRGLIVRTGTCYYVIPVQQIVQVIRVTTDSISLGDGRSVLSYMDEFIPAVGLTEILGSGNGAMPIKQDNEVPLVIIAYGAGKTACIVDEVLQVQEIVVRPLGSQLKRVKRITGAAVLGDGKIALVLDPPDLIQEGIRRAGLVQSYACPPDHKRILIAEDSVTSRALLRKTLENAGYEVITAVDGVDAFTRLREQDVDLVVSDVDMPRMNGFTLTEKIRTDERLCKTPVILVTALDTPEDREHGISSGANAYILKANFEKSDLVRIVRRWLQ